ncbi:MAG: glycosyltransferase family 4 protein, partial [Gemmatimonadota bacterium]
MRVAVFSGSYNHIADGVSLTLNDLVAHLGRRGIPCRVFAPTADDPALDHAGTLTPVPSVAVPGRSEYRLTLGLTPSVREALREFRPNLFHVAAPDPLGLQAVHLARSENIPVAATFNTHFPSYLDYYGFGVLERVAWCYLRHFYRQCDQVYVPTGIVRDMLRRQGIESDIRLWRRGVELDRFNPTRRSASWREEHEIAGDDVVVTFVGRLVREKGLQTFAEVVRRLERGDVPHRSVVVGDGPDREELEERLPNTIFTGFLEGETLARAYASSDVFLFPSDTETFGKVTLEAMASGLPAVCADAGGSRELVQDGRTGLLCPPGDADAFAEAVRRLVLNPGLRQRMGEAAVHRAEDF